MTHKIRTVDAQVTRLGVALHPDGEHEHEGVLNPASALDQKGRLLLFTRSVAKGNVSRVGIVRMAETSDGALTAERLGFALEPEADYERQGNGGEGCEDPRVTFIPTLGVYLMGYTAYSKEGPRIALAWSHDAYNWHRLGTVQFPRRYKLNPDDKDVGFFPEPVLSPTGVLSIAFYHRPMPQIPATGGLDGVQSILAAGATKRQCVRIAYVPLMAVHDDLHALLHPTESRLVLRPVKAWGSIKVGGGTPPVRIDEGWLSLYHGVDAVPKAGGGYCMRYSAGLLIHDLDDPHRIRYRSPKPLFVPETDEELSGTVNNVVFPTALVPRPDLGEHTFDVYYGMADFRIGRLRLVLGKTR